MVDALGFRAQVALAQNRTQDAEAFASSLIGQATAHGLLELPHVGYYLATAGAVGLGPDGPFIANIEAVEIDGFAGVGIP